MKEKWICRWLTFLPQDCKAAERKLNEWGAQGLDYVGRGLLFARFRQADGPVSYSVEYTGGRREYDSQEYLQLCADAGWELVYQDASVNLFKSKPGEQPAPLQTDSGLEWKTSWSKGDRGLLIMLGILLVSWVMDVVRWVQAAPADMWTWNKLAHNGWLLLAPISFVAGMLVLASLIRSALYRSRCRRAAKEGDPFPVPAYGAVQFWGAFHTLGVTIYLLAILVCVLWVVGEAVSQFDRSPEGLPVMTMDDAPAVRRRYRDQVTSYESILLNKTVYQGWGSDGDGFVRVESEWYDCAFPWMADGIVRSLLEQEEAGDAGLYHSHEAGIVPRETDLGFDRSWFYAGTNEEDGKPFQCLILRQGNVTARIEGALDFRDPDILELVRVRLQLED